MDYDEEEDIFYVRLREPDVRTPRTEEAGHGVLIDRDPTTRAIVGIEIFDFFGHFAVLQDRSWLTAFGLSPAQIAFLHQKAQELLQKAATSPSSW